MHVKTAVQVLGTVLLVLLFMSSCPILSVDYPNRSSGTEDNGAPEDGSGGILIDFGAGHKSARTIGPAPEDIKRYDIEGGFAGGSDTFSGSVTPGETFAQYGLTPGTWTITVAAYSAETGGDMVAEGTAQAEVIAGLTTSVSIVLLPVSGIGTLDLTVRWNKHLFAPSEEIIAAVSPAIGLETNLYFGEVSEHGNFRSSRYENADVPTGYYVISIQLIGDGQLAWGIAEAVQILKGLSTTHTYTYDP